MQAPPTERALMVGADVATTTAAVVVQTQQPAHLRSGCWLSSHFADEMTPQ